MKLQNKKHLLNFLQEGIYGIISTVNKEGLPDAAPVIYVNDSNFDTFFITPDKTQKYRNIKLHPEIVLTVTNEEKKETLQLRGIAHEEKELLSSILLRFTNKLNTEKNYTGDLPVLDYKNQEKTVIKIKPYQVRWRKYTDSGFEEKILEISNIDMSNEE